MNENIQQALKQPKFRWLAKHLNHNYREYRFSKEEYLFFGYQCLV